MTKTPLDVLQAVQARIQSIPLVCYDRDPDPTPTGWHWVVLTVDAGNLYTQSLGAQQDANTIYFRPMVVGTSQAAALDGVALLRNSLVGWDMFSDEPTASRVEEEETTPPLLPYTGVALAFLYTVTPTYKIRFVR